MNNTNDIIKRIQEGDIVIFEISNVSTMNQFLLDLSEQFGQFKVFSLIKSSLVEFVLNGFKAYMKRSFFEKNSLSIEKDYEIGMLDFKKSMHEGSFSNQDISNLNKFIQIKFSLIEKDIYLQVINFSSMSKEEEASVSNLFLKGKSSKNLNSHLDDQNDSEGAGLGFLLIFSIIKNLDLSLDCIGYNSNQDSTEFYLKIPLLYFKNEEKG